MSHLLVSKIRCFTSWHPSITQKNGFHRTNKNYSQSNSHRNIRHVPLCNHHLFKYNSFNHKYWTHNTSHGREKHTPWQNGSADTVRLGQTSSHSPRPHSPLLTNNSHTPALSHTRKHEQWIPVCGLGDSNQSRKKYTKLFLDSFFQMSDPLADTTVHTLLKNSEHQDWYRKFMEMKSIKNGDLLPREFPQALHEYVALAAKLPTYADPFKLRQASDLLQRHSVAITASLHWSSLPFTYSVPEGAILLERTQSLNRLHAKNSSHLSYNTPRNTSTTTNTTTKYSHTPVRLLSSIHKPSAFAPHRGTALVDVAKIRLSQAFLRYDLSHGNLPWCFEKDGVPINQKDQARTLMASSAVVMDALERLGILLFPEERDNIVHLWRVVGDVLGIDHRLLPHTPEDSFGLTRAISREYQRPSSLGSSLTRSLLQFLEQSTPEKLEGLNSTMIRYLVGDAVANDLEMKEHIAPQASRMVNIVRDAMRRVPTTTTDTMELGSMNHVYRHIEKSTSPPQAPRAERHVEFSFPTTRRAGKPLSL